MIAWLIVELHVQPTEALELDAALVPALREAWKRRGFWAAVPTASLAARVSAFLGSPIPPHAMLGPFTPAPERVDQDVLQDRLEAMLRQVGGPHGNS